MSSWCAFLSSVCLLGVFWALGEHKAKARHLLVLDFYLVLARLCLPGVEDCVFCCVGQRGSQQGGRAADGAV